MKELVIIGESHTRSFAFRQNISAFFIGNGKEINLEKSNTDNIQRKLNKILENFNGDEVITFIYFGEPNCRWQLKQHWTPHWDEIRHNERIQPVVKEKYLNKCIRNYEEMDLDKVDYIITPTSAYDTTNPALKFFNDRLKETFGDKVIDIFTDSVEDLKTKNEFKSDRWKKDPIHLNSNISNVFLSKLKERGIINDISVYDLTLDGGFDTHYVRNNKFEKSRFGSFIIP